MIQKTLDQALECHHSGRLEEAKQLYRQILSRDPENPVALHYLGVIAMQAGHFDISLDLIRKAIRFRPGSAEAHNSLGNTLMATDRAAEALVAYRQAVLIRPDYAEAHNNVGNALRAAKLLDQAIDAYRRSIELNPSFAETHGNLGTALRERGDVQAAIASYRQALSISPDSHAAHSDLILAMLLDPAQSGKTVLEESRLWDHLHAAHLRKPNQPFANDRSTDRRLRIGYVSPDFRNHVVGKNLLPLLSHHDHVAVEVTCYAQVSRADAITQQLQAKSNRWRNTVGMTDDRLAEQIREDQIDILVDLALHTPGNRLLAFARRPAPVQITYLGYCGTTGLTEMDYRLSDPFLDPPQADLSLYSETTVRLESSYWCYEPEKTAPDVCALPAVSAGSIMFGCLNNCAKVSSSALDIWSGILRSVAGSRLLLHAKTAVGRQRVADQMARAGVDPDRIEFVGEQPYREYLRTYNRIDISLDPFPYTGGITSCDSLWMGVPFVTLQGTQSAVGRGGCSILHNPGLEELVALDCDQYEAKAVQLTANLPGLVELRKTLRDRMRSSPLMDGVRFARNVEAVYRRLWRNWCESPLPPKG